jgi:hypothetical protein
MTLGCYTLGSLLPRQSAEITDIQWVQLFLTFHAASRSSTE